MEKINLNANLNAEIENCEELILGYRYASSKLDFDPFDRENINNINQKLKLLLNSDDDALISTTLYRWYVIAVSARETGQGNLSNVEFNLDEAANLAKNAIATFLKQRAITSSSGILSAAWEDRSFNHADKICKALERFFESYVKSLKLDYPADLNLWFVPWQMVLVLAKELRHNPQTFSLLHALIDKVFKPQGGVLAVRPFYLCHIMIEALTGASYQASLNPKGDLGFLSLLLKNQGYDFSGFADAGELDFLGVPGGAAFNIATDYLYGCNLKRDRRKALFWFRHGALTGEPRCLVACVMLERDLNVTQSPNGEILYAAKENFYLLQNAFVLAAIYQKERGGKGPNHDLLFINDAYFSQGKRSSFTDDCLFNLFCWYEYFLNCKGIDVAIWPNADQDLVLQELTYASLFEKTDLKANVELSTVLAVYLDHFQLDVDFYKSKLPHLLKDQSNLGNRVTRMEAIMEEGIKSDDPFTLNYYIRLLRDEDLLQRLNDKAINALMRQGDDLCLMMLADRKLSAQSNFLKLPDEIVELWTMSAKHGNSLGMMNLAAYLAISGVNREQAWFWARRALSFGMTSAYFMLYKLSGFQTNQLSCSYLFMAAKYLLPEACMELKSLKEKGLFHPLPFISLIEELESQALEKVPYCLILSELYNQGGLMPQNKVKALALLQQAASLGDNSCMMSLEEEMSERFACEENPLDFFRPLTSTLYDLVNSDVLPDDPQKMLKERQQAQNLMQKIYDSLSHGKTDFERSIFLHCAQNGLWKAVGIKENQSIQSKERVLSLEVPKLFTRLSANFLELYKQDVLADYADSLRYLAFKNPEDNRYGYALKAMLSLRSWQLPPDVRLLKKMSRLASNAEVQLCMLTANLHLEGIFTDSLRVGIEKTSSTQQNRQNCQENIMITAINQ